MLHTALTIRRPVVAQCDTSYSRNAKFQQSFGGDNGHIKERRDRHPKQLQVNGFKFTGHNRYGKVHVQLEITVARNSNKEPHRELTYGDHCRRQ